MKKTILIATAAILVIGGGLLLANGNSAGDTGQSDCPPNYSMNQTVFVEDCRFCGGWFHGWRGFHGFHGWHFGGFGRHGGGHHGR